MIPRTFPSSVASNGSTQMIVYFLPSVSGMTRWVDYIPVKFTTVATAATENTYNQNGYIPVVSISSITGATPFKEYVPVFLDSSAADAEVWKVNITGFIPVGTAGIGGIISSLFTAGEQGWVYDPSDFNRYMQLGQLSTATMFQDAAGTTPVTAMEQPLGLQLDLRNGLPVLGTELVTNGTFETNITGWVVGNAGQSTLAWSDGKLRITRVNAGDTYPNARTTLTGLTVGRIYKIVSATNNPFGIEAYHSIAGIASSTVRTTLASKTLECVFTATATSHNLDVGIWATSGSAGQYVEFDNISVKELPGNHRFQTNSANRPVVSARVNLLTKTEQFDDAAWQKLTGGVGSLPVVTRNYAAAPDGTLTASRIQLNAGANGPSDYSLLRQTFTNTGLLKRSILVKSNTGEDQTFCIVATNSATKVTATPEWQTLSIELLSGSAQFDISVGGTGLTGATADILVCAVDARPANIGVNLPPYQRVNTSTDYDTAGFPVYIKPNGSNQFMVSNAIDFTATDKMTVWAGVRKLSDVARGIFTELSSSTAANVGSFVLTAPEGATSNYGFGSRGSILNSPIVASAFAAPITNAITGIGDISGDQATLRVNSTQVATSSADQGTGNYGNYAAYHYARAGTSLFFNGHDYGSICRGAVSSAAQITAAEGWINQRTKAF